MPNQKENAMFSNSNGANGVRAGGIFGDTSKSTNMMSTAEGSRGSSGLFGAKPQF